MVGIFVCAFRMSLLAYDEERYMIVNRSDEKIGDFKCLPKRLVTQRSNTVDLSQLRETLYDLLCRYKWGYIGSLRQLREVVENAIGKKYSISTLLRKVRKLDESTQKGTDSSEQVREQSLHQISNDNNILIHTSIRAIGKAVIVLATYSTDVFDVDYWLSNGSSLFKLEPSSSR
ncbi:unnamed protein product [Toxocara canis]|uniref:ANF_receptor domain-containing protein n=1 Tax=Toxocara canis TaxID=6265 RepID=A0A183V4P7_TOXCA|nr:unnamed protein product [Toxocara canis]